MASSAGSVHLEIEGALATLTLDRSQAANALSQTMVEQLEAHLEVLEGAGCAGLVLTGAGGRFCAGSDLAAVRAGLDRPSDALALCERMTSLTERLEALPMVRVAAVEGSALGGGMELLLVAHRVVASGTSTLGFVQTRLGLTPGWGGAGRLVERVGVRRATLLLAEAQKMSAQAAQAAGLVDAVVSPGSALAESRKWLLGLPAWSSPEVLREMVALCSRGGRAGAAEAFSAVWGGTLHRAALARVPQGRS